MTPCCKPRRLAKSETESAEVSASSICESRDCHSSSGERPRSNEQASASVGRNGFLVATRDTISATASAAVSACQPRCVNWDEALTNSRRFSCCVAKNAPIIALRMAGPLPPEVTPLRFAGNPNQSFRQALAVAKPTPAGNPRNHQRNFQASARWNRATSRG